MRISRMNQILLFLTIIITMVSLTAVLFYSSRPYGGYFMAGSISYIEQSLALSNGAHLDFSNLLNKNIIGNEIWIYEVHAITGLSYESMQWMPINYILIAIGLLALSKCLLGNAWLALGVFTIFLLNLKFDVADATFFVKGSGMFLFIMFAHVLFRNRGNFSGVWIFLLITFFATNHFFDYTSQAWMLVVILSYGLLVRNDKPQFKMIAISGIIMLILYVLSRNIIFSGYLVNLSVDTLWNTLIGLVEGSHSPSNPYTYVNLVYPEQHLFNSIVFGLLILISAAYALSILRRLVGRKGICSDDVCFIALLLPFPATLVLYLPLGLATLGYVILIFPLLCAYALLTTFRDDHNTSWPHRFDRLRGHGTFIAAGFLIILVVLSSISYASVIRNDSLPTNSDTNMAAASEWLLEHHSGEVRLLSDLDSLGKAQVAWADSLNYSDLKLIYYNSSTYGFIVEGGHSSELYRSTDYVMVDCATNAPAQTLQWINFKPLCTFHEAVNMNNDIETIFTNGQSKMFKVSYPWG